MKTNPEPDPTNVSPKRGRLDPLTLLIKRHLRFGWWSLLVFLTLGIVLEALHGFKVGLYLNVSNETRRLMWTLAHAHGTLLALVHIAFGATLHLIPSWNVRLRDLASASLVGASTLIPAGFFLGGVVIYAGDPGLGILLLPLGAVLLFVAVLLTARGAESLLNPGGVETGTEAKGRDEAKLKANR
ncbi:MAG: hypothetical protein EXS30_07490 [Pedosphaera sp.]|nr:hypothetical protein [Pedosphaera sp.]